jgi:hypothetical protein
MKERVGEERGENYSMRVREGGRKREREGMPFFFL